MATEKGGAFRAREASGPTAETICPDICFGKKKKDWLSLAIPILGSNIVKPPEVSPVSLPLLLQSHWWSAMGGGIPTMEDPGPSSEVAQF